jgi:hypothetical protein
MDKNNKKTHILYKTALDESEIIDGNSLIGSVIEKKDPLLPVCIDKLNDMSDIDMDKVMAVKQKIDSGTYDFDSKIKAVVESLIDESLDPNPLSYPLFDS